MTLIRGRDARTRARNGREDSILTVPSYMGFFLEFDGVEDIDLPVLDIDEVNRLARQMFVE